MPGYALVCSVCRASLESRSGWLEHLVQEPHQRVAQAQVASWTRKTRKCCLVVFASFPIMSPSDGGGGGIGLQLVEHFSSNKGLFPGIIVTDFVIIPSQPCVAVLQFESKEAVSDVLQKVGGGPKISVNDQVLQIRMGKNYLDLEWNVIIGNAKAELQNCNNKTGNNTEETTFVTRKRRKQVNVDEQNNDDDGQEPEMNVSTGVALVETTTKVSKCNIIAPQPEDKEETSSTSTSNSKVPVISALRSQYHSLRAEILMPYAKFKSASLLMNKLEKEFTKQFKEYPHFKLYMFRNCHLGLKNFLCHSDLWFYADFQDQLSGRPVDTTLKLDQQKIDAVIIGSTTDVTKVPPSTPSSSPPKIRAGWNRACYLDPTTGLTFRIDSHPFCRTEVQTDRLLSYLCQFDARVRPLLSLGAYWWVVNKISWSTSKMNSNMLSFIPEPAAFHWLVVLFLCNKKVIPTPREIRERERGGPPNQVIVNVNTVNNVDCDIGFAIDEEYAVRERKSKSDSVPPDRSDDFLVDVITLAKDFFSYFAKLGSGSWILNTKDGEVWSKTDFLNRAPNNPSGFSTQLAADEMTHLMSSKLQSAQDVRSTGPSHRVVILHPLLIHDGKFAFSSTKFTKACPIMKQTSDQLEAYLRNVNKRDKVMRAPRISLKSMLQVVV